jgi:hypothetical protein
MTNTPTVREHFTEILRNLFNLWAKTRHGAQASQFKFHDYHPHDIGETTNPCVMYAAGDAQHSIYLDQIVRDLGAKIAEEDASAGRPSTRKL